MTDESVGTSGSLAGKTYLFVLGTLFFILLLSLPTGITSWFDGFPWTGKVETLAVVIVSPLFFILGRGFFVLRKTIIFLAVLLALKIVMFSFPPSGGWLIKIYPNLNVNQERELSDYLAYPLSKRGRRDHIDIRGDYKGWVKSYATLWNKNATGILQEPWTKTMDFPVDWLIPLTDDLLRSIKPTVEIEGNLLLPKGKKFALVTRGVEEGTLRAKNNEGKTYVLSSAKSFKDAKLKEYQLPGGESWHITGKLRYAGGNWSLIPVWVAEDGTVSSNMGRDFLWQDKSILSKSSLEIQFYKYLSWVIDISIVLFFLAWGTWIGRLLIQDPAFSPPLIVFSALAIILPFIIAPYVDYILAIFNTSDPTTASYLGISVILAAAGLLLWSNIRNDYRAFQADRVVFSIFLFIALPILSYFSIRFFQGIGQWNVWGTFEDWVSYQWFARKLIVRGEWLSAGEGSTQGKELYPYIVGVLHWLFGKSSFAQHMADIWSVLVSAVILGGLAIKFRLSPLLAFITSTAYLAVNFIGSFRYHLGRSMTENTAMIFMMLAAWFLVQAREGGASRVVLAIFFGVLGFWSRLDHLGVIVGLAFLTLEPIKGPTGGWKGYWERFRLRWRPMIWYWAGGFVIGVLGLLLRNWFLGAGFWFADSGSIASVGGITSYNFYPEVPRMFYLILTGNSWPHFPSISAFIMTFGTFTAFVALWRPKVLQNAPLGLALAIALLLVPYFYVGIPFYPPRFSIHLLPLALLFFMIFINRLFKGFKRPLKL